MFAYFGNVKIQFLPKKQKCQLLVKFQKFVHAKNMFQKPTNELIIYNFFFCKLLKVFAKDTYILISSRSDKKKRIYKKMFKFLQNDNV